MPRFLPPASGAPSNTTAWPVSDSPRKQTFSTHLIRAFIGLLHTQQFNIKYQCCVRWNHAACTACAITHLWWNHQSTFATNLHTSKTFIPALNDLTTTKVEYKWLATIN